MASPFDILGVSPDADEDERKRAYRERAKEAHPDRGGSVDEFQLVRSAYERIEDGYEPGDEAHSPEGDSPTTDPVSRAEQRTSRVEYLNYEALDDFGWDLRDDDLFRKASDAGLSHEDYGKFVVEPDESILEAAENRGFAWPFACRGGACANCAIVLTKGELSMPADTVLPDDLYDHGVRLSCNAMPLTRELQIVFNAKYLPELEELQLPPYPFRKAHGD